MISQSAQLGEGSTTGFVMYGTRAAMVAGLAHVEQQVVGIERAVEENPGLAFDLARTLIESTCRTILTERNQAFAPADDLPKLFKTVCAVLPFLPADASKAVDARKSLTKTLSGLNTGMQGITELRNAYGFASHGSDGPRPPMESVQALLAAASADAIVGFLYGVHVQDRTPSAASNSEFGDNVAFNEYVDTEHGEIRIFESEFRASEILFQLEPETYRINLAEYDPSQDETLETVHE